MSVHGQVGHKVKNQLLVLMKEIVDCWGLHLTKQLQLNTLPTVLQLVVSSQDHGIVDGQIVTTGVQSTLRHK